MVGFKKTAPILKWQKLDDGGLRFEACFSSEAPDSQGDIVLQSATQKAVERWKAKNIREMHEPIAVGKAIEFDFPADGKSYLVGHVTAGAPLTVKKVEDDVLKMLSIAGPPPTKTSRKVIDGKSYRVFEEYDLAEISLVDNGSNPDAWISVTKAAGLDDSEGAEMQKNDMSAPVSDAAEAAIEECAKAAAPCDIPGHDKMTPEEHAKAHEADAEKATPEPEVKKTDDMAPTDIRTGLDALVILEGLLAVESYEVTEGAPEPPEQVRLLQAAITAVKAFVASEASELLEAPAEKSARAIIVKVNAPAPKEIDLDELAAKVAALLPIQKSAPAPEPDARIETIQKAVGDLNAVPGEIKAIRDGIEKILAQPVPGRAPARNLVPLEQMSKSARPNNDADALRKAAAAAPPHVREWMLHEATAIERG